jgi:hypothetical protein
MGDGPESPPSTTLQTGSGKAEKSFYCSGFGSRVAKTRAKEGAFLAAAGEKTTMRPVSNADPVAWLLAPQRASFACGSMEVAFFFV